MQLRVTNTDSRSGAEPASGWCALHAGRLGGPEQEGAVLHPWGRGALRGCRSPQMFQRSNKWEWESDFLSAWSIRETDAGSCLVWYLHFKKGV